MMFAALALLAAALFFAGTMALAIPWRLLCVVALAAIAAYVATHRPPERKA